MDTTSLDWSREFFTLDAQRSTAVIEAFVRLYESGLIYRANRLINWCCHLRTAISNIEIDTLELEKSTMLTVPSQRKKYDF
jgi:valyl-tRNA synthetase